MTRKVAFFEEWSWFKLNNLGLALGTNLKFCNSVAKELKLKVRKFWGPTPTFVEVTGEKLVGGSFCPPPISWIELSFLINNKVYFICSCRYLNNNSLISFFIVYSVKDLLRLTINLIAFSKLSLIFIGKLIRIDFGSIIITILLSSM